MPTSKFANEITANSLDGSNYTVDRKFARAMIIAQPVNELETKNIITVKETGPHTDKVVFTVIPEQSWIFREVDARGSEVSSTPSASYQAFTAPTFKEVQPTTKAAVIFLHDNINLADPVTFKEIAQTAGNQLKKQKITAAMTTASTVGNYTAGTSIFNAGGYTAKGTVAADDTLVPNDLRESKISLKTQTNYIDPDTCLLHTQQLNQIENHADFSPGQLTNANFKKAVFDENGKLVKFDGMEIIEVLQIPAQTTGDFTSVNGHMVVIGKKGLMIGRGENNRKNGVEDFRDPSMFGTKRVLKVNYDHEILYPDGIRLLQAAD